LVLITDAHVLYIEAAMKISLGLKWTNLFELVIADARKPLFQRTLNPFYEVDVNKVDLRGQQF